MNPFRQKFVAWGPRLCAIAALLLTIEAAVKVWRWHEIGQENEQIRLNSPPGPLGPTRPSWPSWTGENGLHERDELLKAKKAKGLKVPRGGPSDPPQ